MEKYIPRHRATGPIEGALARFRRWTAESSMNPMQETLCGACLGLWWAFIVFHCYFG